MSTQKFIHAADVHLDSPLAHLRRLDSKAAERIHQATRQALTRVVDAASEHEVAAVVIAGDLFDRPVRDSGAGLWVESQFRKLTRQGIPVILIRGNHDANSNSQKVINWPEGVHELSSQKPQTIRVDAAGLAIHGQSFGANAEQQDLAKRYPDAVPGMFNIGVLHTSLSGDGAHDTYAPTSVEVLEGKGYEYWALGHIHARSPASLSQNCYVGYSGNTQGRHIREQGAKGCHLVEIEDNQLREVKFLATDQIRWHEILLDATGLEHFSDVEDALIDELQAPLDSAGDRQLAIRVRLTGNTQLHRDLSRFDYRESLCETLSDRFGEMGEIWLESLRVETRIGQQPVGVDLDLPLKYVERVAADMEAELPESDELRLLFDDLIKKTRKDLKDYRWPLLDSDSCNSELASLLKQAKDLLETHLLSEAGQ